MNLKKALKAKVAEKNAPVDLPSVAQRKKLRESLGLSQREAAEVMANESGMEITRAMVGQWELGKNRPSEEVLPVYQEFLKAAAELANTKS